MSHVSVYIAPEEIQHLTISELLYLDSALKAKIAETKNVCQGCNETWCDSLSIIKSYENRHAIVISEIDATYSKMGG